MTRAACGAGTGAPESPPIATHPGGFRLHTFLLFGILFPSLPVILSQTLRMVIESSLTTAHPEYVCALRTDPVLDQQSAFPALRPSNYARLTVASALEVWLTPKSVPPSALQAQAYLIHDGVAQPWPLPLVRTPAGAFYCRLPLTQLPELQPGLWTLGFQVTSSRSTGLRHRIKNALLPARTAVNAPWIYGVLEIHAEEKSRGNRQ